MENNILLAKDVFEASSLVICLPILLQVPTYVALSIKAVPTKLARSINLLAEGDEDMNKLVGDVFPKASSDSA